MNNNLINEIASDIHSIIIHNFTYVDQPKNNDLESMIDLVRDYTTDEQDDGFIGDPEIRAIAIQVINYLESTK